MALVKQFTGDNMLEGGMSCFAFVFTPSSLMFTLFLPNIVTERKHCSTVFLFPVLQVRV